MYQKHFENTSRIQKYLNANLDCAHKNGFNHPIKSHFRS